MIQLIIDCMKEYFVQIQLLGIHQNGSKLTFWSSIHICGGDRALLSCRKYGFADLNLWTREENTNSNRKKTFFYDPRLFQNSKLHPFVKDHYFCRWSDGEGGVCEEIDGTEGMELAMEAWADWMASNFDPLEKKAFFVTMSPTHHS